MKSFEGQLFKIAVGFWLCKSFNAKQQENKNQQAKFLIRQFQKYDIFILVACPALVVPYIYIIYQE